MENISKPSIIKLARQSGVKTISDDTINPIRNIILEKLDEILTKALIVNSTHRIKTLSTDDIFTALELSNINITHSSKLNGPTCSK